MTRIFTGRHMAAIMIAFFGVVITVNVYMAREATSTFGGEVVENSYVASQHFNRWLGEAAQEKALGWNANIHRTDDGRIEVRIAGLPDHAMLSAIARHPLGQQPDQALAFARKADGEFLSTAPLPAGRWRLRLEAVAGGKLWRSEGDIL